MRPGGAFAVCIEKNYRGENLDKGDYYLHIGNFNLRDFAWANEFLKNAVRVAVESVS